MVCKFKLHEVIKVMGKKPENSFPTSALEVLQGLLEKGNSPLAEDFKRYRLKLDWASVVGSSVAEKCSPVGFSKGILFVWVINSTWMNQLFFMRREILKSVNKYAGRRWVHDIRLTQNQQDVPADAQWKEDQQPSPSP